MKKNLPEGNYKKHHSFDTFSSAKASAVPEQKARALRLLSGALNYLPYEQSILSLVRSDLEAGAGAAFTITQFIAEEMDLLQDNELPRFLFHRYRYDVFPQKRILDDYPPYVQIEPTSLCNYRCVFCYQTDTQFFKKSMPGMGSMTLDTFKRIADEIQGKVEFLSLASRGEPLLCRDIVGILEYSVGKFLSLKLNTNASVLTEEYAHAILKGGVRTLVFSADAAEEPLYSQLRVNGKLDRVLKNIEMFQKIRTTQYPESRIVTRVSGVRVSDAQSLKSMDSLWGSLVDQVAFVKYNPWENIYEAQPNGTTAPCSDLWRRMFVWQDGTVNPCDTDYRSTLSVGSLDANLRALWHADKYVQLRKAHENGSRQVVEPCRRCAVV